MNYCEMLCHLVKGWTTKYWEVFIKKKNDKKKKSMAYSSSHNSSTKNCSYPTEFGNFILPNPLLSAYTYMQYVRSTGFCGHFFDLYSNSL